MATITFICPNCHQTASLVQVAAHVTEVRVCTAWLDEQFPEADTEDTVYDNAEYTYECGLCQNELVLAHTELAFSNRAYESLKNWVKRHQTEPPTPFALPELPVAVAPPVTATSVIRPDEPEPVGNPELLP